MKKIILGALGATLIGLGLNANAGTAVATINPTVTLTGACTLDTSGVLTDFGSIPAGSLLLAPFPAGTIQVTCANGTAWLVGMDVGSNQPSGANRRSLALVSSPTNTIDYSYIIGGGAGDRIGDGGLNTIDPSYSESASNIGFGVSDNGLGVNGLGTGGLQTIDLDVEVFLGGQEPSGTYTDTVVITVAF